MNKILGLFLIASIAFFSCQLPKQESTSPEETTYSMDGAIQKGPFQKGSTVTVQEVDKNLDPTGRMYTTTTKDDLGAFDLASKFSSQYVEVTSKGFYFNECTNQTVSAEISLRSYGDLSINKSLNLNVLTTIAHGRIKTLVESGKGFADARDQAESELLALLGFSAVSGLHFYEFSLASGGDDAAMLLAVSATLQGERSVAQLSQFIADLEQDFADDGTISNDDLITQLRNSASAITVSTIINNVKVHYQNRGNTIEVKDFTSYKNTLTVAGGVIGKPAFSLSSGTYIEEQIVTITAPVGAEIHYTLDGSDPNINSTLYVNPIRISLNADVSLKAVSVLDDVISPINSARYIVKEGKYFADYFNTTPGKFIEYDFSGYSKVSSSTLMSYKVYSVFQKIAGSTPINIQISSNNYSEKNSGGYAFLTAPPAGSTLNAWQGGSIAGGPYFAWYYYTLVSLPERIIFDSQYSSYFGVTYVPKKLSSWAGFSDVIQINFDSTAINISGDPSDDDLENELKGIGKFIYAKGIGIIYLEITHTSPTSNPLNKTTTMTYSKHGDAPLITFRGTYNITGVAAQGYKVAPVGGASMLARIPVDSYSTVTSEGNFEFEQFAMPGSYFVLWKIPLTGSSQAVKVLIPMSSNTLNIGEIGAIYHWGQAAIQ